MKAPVAQAWPASRLRRHFRTFGRVSGYACHLKASQQAIDRRREPARMARLQHNPTPMQFPQSSKEFLRDTFIKSELRRKLDEHRSKFGAEGAYRVEELQQSAASIH